MTFATAADLVSWVAILLLALVVVRLLRRVRELSARVPPIGLPSGTRAPALDRLSVEPDGTALLLFLSTSCPACPAVLDEALATSAAVPIHLVYPEGSLPMNGTARPVRVHTGERDLLDAYRVPATPFAVLVERGRVRRAEPIRSPQVLHELTGTSPAG